jgi:hypothetical protein
MADESDWKDEVRDVRKPVDTGETGEPKQEGTPSGRDARRRRDDVQKHIAVAIVSYSVLFFVWLAVPFVVRYWPLAQEGPASARASRDLIETAVTMESWLPDSLLIQVPEGVVGGNSFWLHRAAIPDVENHLIAARDSMQNQISDLWVTDLARMLGLLAALLIVTWLAVRSVRLTEIWGTALAVYILAAVLIMLGSEVVEWLAAAPGDRDLVNTFKGVALGSAMGGVTYVLINIGAKWRRLYEDYIRPRQEERHILEERLDLYRDQWMAASILPAKDRVSATELRAQLELDAEFRQVVEEMNNRIETLVLEEADEVYILKQSYGKVHLDRRVLHVIMSMLLALGFAVVALALGVDFLDLSEPPPPNGQDMYPAAVLAASFLVGLFPRVFERFMKGVADRLIGSDEEHEEGGEGDRRRPRRPRPTRQSEEGRAGLQQLQAQLDSLRETMVPAGAAAGGDGAPAPDGTDHDDEQASDPGRSDPGRTDGPDA